MSTENNLKSCSFCVGNAAAMLKALKYIIKQIDKNPERLSAGQLLCIIGDKADSALSAPPRNCDVGTAEEQVERFDQQCRGRIECASCPCLTFDDKCSILQWAQMPYDEEEGGAK